MPDTSSIQHIREEQKKAIEADYSNVMAGIMPSNTENATRILEKIHDEISASSFLVIFGSEHKVDNFLNYFIKFVKDRNSQHMGISKNFVDDLSIWIDNISNNFQALNLKPEIYNKLFYLVEKIIADPHLDTQKFHYLTNTIYTFIALMEDLLKQGHDITVDPFVNLFDQISRKQQIPIEYKSELATELTQLGSTCLQQEVCNATLVLNKFTKVLGTMVSNIAESEISSRNLEIAKIENTVQQLFNNAAGIVPESKLKEIAISFIQQYSNETQLTEKCASLFNFTDCQVNIAKQVTRIIPSVTVNQSNSVNIENSALAEKNNDVNPLANSGVSLGAAAAHGVGSGILNGIIQYFASKYSQDVNQSSKTKAIVIYSSLLAHAAFATTFPLMLFKIQEHINQGNENEAQELWDNLLYQALPTFISSAGFSLGLQIVSECTRLLSNLTVQRILRNTLPLAGIASNLFKNPVPTAVQISASVFSSSLTQLGLNRFFPNDIKSTVKIEENDIESQTTASPATNSIEFTKKYRFLNEGNLGQVRDNSFQLQTSLNSFIFSLKESKQNDMKAKCEANTNGVKKEYDKNIQYKEEVINKLIKPAEMVNELHARLMDEEHEKACLVYTDLNEYMKVMGTTGNVFKMMQVFYDTTTEDVNLRNALSVVTGFVDGHEENFAQETSLKLNMIQKLLSTLLSNAQRFVSIYNVSDAGYKGERRGEAKAKLLRNESTVSHEPSKKIKRPVTFNGESAYFINDPRDSTTSDDSGNSTLSSTDTVSTTVSIFLENHGLFRNGGSNFSTDTFAPRDTSEKQALIS